MGLYTVVSNEGTLEYKGVDFGEGPSEYIIRLATEGPVSIEIWAGGKNIAEGGTLMGILQDVYTGSKEVYKTWSAEVKAVTGEQDLYLYIKGKEARINWFQFLPLKLNNHYWR
jgi:hypothetical protein